MSTGPAYAWRRGGHSVSADVAVQELERIRKKRGDFFVPQDLVDESWDSKAPLHDEFEWDDQKAAGAWRVGQAAGLIRNIVVVQEGRPRDERVRAYVSVSVEDQGPSYTTLTHAMADDELREKVLAQALADMRAMERKYQQFMDLSQVVKAFRKAHLRASSPAYEQMAS